MAFSALRHSRLGVKRPVPLSLALDEICLPSQTAKAFDLNTMEAVMISNWITRETTKVALSVGVAARMTPGLDVTPCCDCV
jgi:hypothetical protein